ncbi:MAG: alpha-mannosidase [Puniceicoccaceae bacterium]
MLPKSYLSQLLLVRIAEAVERLEKRIWTPVSGPWRVKRTAPQKGHRKLDEVEIGEFKEIGELPDVWGERFDQCWWQLPEELIAEAREHAGSLYLDWRDDGEATLYADGVPWHGIDPGHRYVPLPTVAKDLKIESICLRSGIWVPGNWTRMSDEGSKFEGAYTLKRDEDTWKAWVTMDLMKEFMDHGIRKAYPEHRATEGSAGFRPALDKIDPLLRRLAHGLDECLDILDANGIPAFNKSLSTLLASLPADGKQILSCVLTGHAHIDLVWLWPESVGEFKAVHTFSTMNRLLDKYPEFRFGYSQPMSYEAVNRRNPELMDIVRGHIQDQRWEVEGATYVESDTQLPCGESLVRSFLLGQKGFEALTGKLSSTLWLPDVFGYSGSLPQIMAQTGVSRFFTTKLTWCSVSRFPHSSFRWLGFDGTEVMVHVTQAYGYNGQVGIKEIDDGQLHYQQASVHDAYLAPTGWGDGGGGPTEAMCERARILNNFAGMPPTQWGRIDEFFDSLETVRDKLPAFQGELYMEYHRGVQTTHGDLKSAFRAAERGLQVLEAAHCACKTGPVDEAIWKRLILAQFHDYIPGSSVKEVYDEGIPELNGIAEDSSAAVAALMKARDSSPSDCQFNPLAVHQDAYDSSTGSWHRIPPLSGGPLSSFPETSINSSVNAAADKISNGRVCADFDELGRITSLKIDGADIPFTDPAGELVLYADHPHAYDAWDIDRATLSNPMVVDSPAEVSVLNEDNGQSCCVSFRRKAGKNSVVTIHYKLNAASYCLGIEYDIDWKDPSILLKAVFPTEYRGRHARYGAPFGSSLRVQQPARPDDEAQFENPFNRWIEVSDDGGDEGFFVVSEAKYGATVFQGNVQVSLLRSVFISDPDLEKPADKVKDSQCYSDLMQHKIRLAVGRFKADTQREERAPILADTLFTLPIPYSGEHVNAGLVGIDGLDTVHPCWAKPADSNDGTWILRCHETHGKRGSIRIELKSGYTATAVDLMESPLNVQPDADGNFPVKPYSLFSFLIEPS